MANKQACGLTVLGGWLFSTHGIVMRDGGNNLIMGLPPVSVR
jgi:hypothetical protein